MMRVKDRAVVITGAGGLGSGRAIAIGFASEGARVVVSDVQDEGGERPSASSSETAAKESSATPTFGSKKRSEASSVSPKRRSAPSQSL